MTKIKDLRSMTKEELNSKLKELRKEMIKHNAQIATGTTPKSPGQIREIKKTIARILTIIRTQKGSKLGDQRSSSVSTQNKQKKKPKSSSKDKKKYKKKEEKASKNKQRKK